MKTIYEWKVPAYVSELGDTHFAENNRKCPGCDEGKLSVSVGEGTAKCVGGCGSLYELRYFTPHSDPHEHEYALDYVFDDAASACDWLTNWIEENEDLAVESHTWILVESRRSQHRKGWPGEADQLRSSSGFPDCGHIARGIIAIYIDPHDGTWYPIRSVQGARGLSGSMLVHEGVSAADFASLSECASYKPTEHFVKQVDLREFLGGDVV